MIPLFWKTKKQKNVKMKKELCKKFFFWLELILRCWRFWWFCSSWVRMWHQMVRNISRLKCNQSGIFWSNNCKDGSVWWWGMGLKNRLGWTNQKPLSNMNFYHVAFSGFLGSTNFHPLFCRPLPPLFLHVISLQLETFFPSRFPSESRRKKNSRKSPKNNFSSCRFCVFGKKF